VRRSFKYRLYPTRAQAEAMAAILESHRALYNAALEHRRTAYQMRGTTITYGQQSAELKDIRREDAGLAACNFSSCQATLRRLDRTFRAFFRRAESGEKPGYPRFKGRDRFDTVEFPSHGDGCRFSGRRVTFQGVGTVKVKYHRPTAGTVKTVSFKREAGRWFVVVACDLGDAPPTKADGPAVGIDLGLTAFLVTSDGESVSPPRLARMAAAKLRRAQRALSRCRRESKRRGKARARVARCHAKVANQRRDFHHKTAKALTDRYGTICVEALNVGGIARSRLAKAAHDAGWARFLAILGHKAEGASVQVVAVDPRNTTQACSDCGCLPAVPLELSDRVCRCASCGFAGDRDLNAARNVLRRGHRRQAPTEALASVA
jgi:putative transposase